MSLTRARRQFGPGCAVRGGPAPPTLEL